MVKKKPQSEPPRLLSAKKAAAYLGIPYTSLRDLHFRGELPAVKFGNGKYRVWYFERRELDALIERHTERGR
jgi:excisionase family DNA binding protein